MSDKLFTPARLLDASLEVDRLEKELDVTNADHISLWLSANAPMSISYLSVRIAEAYDRAITKDNEITNQGAIK